MKDLEGRVAVITGGASGIGRATGELLARHGMHVVLADVEQSALDGTVGAMRNDALDVTGVLTDVSDLGSMQRLAGEVFERYGNAHALVLNAGVAPSTAGHL